MAVEPGFRATAVTLLVSLLAFAVVGCGRGDARGAAPEETLVVFAAASLREAFTDMEAGFERAHPGVDVTFAFAGSQTLRMQIEHGAPADVFASADRRHMDALARDARVVAPVVFARNEPVIVVARDAAPAIRSLADLPNASRVVLGLPDVPIGRYSLEILDRAAPTLGADFRARVEAKVVSRELDVRQVLGKVSLGEAQAGVVYRTDARAAAGVRVVRIPADINVVAEYPIAVVAAAAHPRLARAWVDFVRSDTGHGALERAGFLSPSRER